MDWAITNIWARIYSKWIRVFNLYTVRYKWFFATRFKHFALFNWTTRWIRVCKEIFPGYNFIIVLICYINIDLIRSKNVLFYFQTCCAFCNLLVLQPIMCYFLLAIRTWVANSFIITFKYIFFIADEEIRTIWKHNTFTV